MRESGTRLFAALIRNITIFCPSLEILSQLVYDGLQNFTIKYHFCIIDYLLNGMVMVSE